MMFYMAPHRSAEQPDLIKMVIKYLGLYLLAPTAPWDLCVPHIFSVGVKDAGSVAAGVSEVTWSFLLAPLTC